MHPYGSSLSSLSFEDMRTMEVTKNLFVVAQKIGGKEFKQADKWLKHCDWISSESSNSVERVVFYFVEALSEKIAPETGKNNEASLEGKKRSEQINATLDFDLATLVFHQEVLTIQILFFVGMQTIIETITSSTKFMSLILQSSVELEEVSKRLSSFAELVKLPFSFKGIYVSKMSEIKEEVFDLEADEAIVVHSPVILRSMILKPKCLKSLIRLNPRLIGVSEVDASLNSHSFVVRFAEALLFYNAFFDCIEACIKVESLVRMVMETTYFGEGIKNIVANEGEERINRSVKLKKAFFARFGLKEIELSNTSIDLAKKVLKKSNSRNFCILDRTGKSLTVGWKGYPLFLVSLELEVGMNLASFAISLNIPFVPEEIYVSDLDKLKEEHFHVGDNEAMATFCAHILITMVSRPKCLESLMMVLRMLYVSIMLVTKVEANHDSLSFVDRFIEALFFYGAYLDCLNDCMSPESQYRQAIELVYFHKGIRNAIADESGERLNRNVKIEVWRTFFERFGMEEIELGESALYHGSLVVKQFACGNFCTFDKMGKFLTIGRVLYSLSSLGSSTERERLLSISSKSIFSRKTSPKPTTLSSVHMPAFPPDESCAPLIQTEDFELPSEKVVGCSVCMLMSFVLRDFKTLPLVSSSAIIWSSSEECRLVSFCLGEAMLIIVAVLELVLATVMDAVTSLGSAITLSKRAASLGEANALSCFPRFRMVAWHSSNFSEAGVISISYQI
ncbi:LOW QUALITY PROTEIN: Transcription factor GRAS [Dillenia turbinata]|uniref:Transcription factor GRAS n=1 Tax=Dillenia turbinata TaxID=194707 RepID=A0AAN8UTS9_9MAGN